MATFVEIPPWRLVYIVCCPARGKTNKKEMPETGRVLRTMLVMIMMTGFHLYYVIVYERILNKFPLVIYSKEKLNNMKVT